MNIGARGDLDLIDPSTGGKWYHDPAYQMQLARLDGVILGFFPGWRNDTDGTLIRQAVQGIKALNPNIRIGQYTILNESPDDPNRSDHDDVVFQVNAMDWWLRDAVTGAKRQWSTQYSAYDINITDWAVPDPLGDRYPQWRAKRDFAQFYGPVPEFDLWYFDGVMRYSRIPMADWRRDGVNVSNLDPEVQTRFRQAHAAHWAAATALAPGRLQMGNADNGLTYAEYRGQLGGAFMEAMMGKSWSLNETQGWPVMMDRYFTIVSNLKEPRLAVFNAWGAVTDYRFFRFAFASCRLGDAYFAFTDTAAGYTSVPWFDEYEVAFGPAIDPPTLAPWQNGVHRRTFQNAMVLVNPNADARTVTVEPGWRRMLAGQDPVTNDGTPVGTLTLGPKDGLVLLRQ
jgi:hypothetical protein